MPSTPPHSSPRPSPLSLRSANSGYNTATPINPNHCQKCLKSIAKSKPALKCNCCHLSAHTGCIPDWTDITTTTELTKITSKSGLTWYCSNCQPKLADYFYGPEIKPSIDQLDDKITQLTKLVSESHKLTRTYAQATATTKGDNAEIKAIAQRLDERSKREIQTRENLERKQSAILHNLPDNLNTHKEVADILQLMNFHPNSTTRISRLGNAKPNSQSSKPRPTKIQFHTEVMKMDFLRLFHSAIDRSHKMFVTPDLSKEDRELEFKLRQTRNELAAKFKENRYRVRGSKLQCQTSGSLIWKIIDANGAPGPQAASKTTTDTSEVQPSTDSLNSQPASRHATDTGEFQTSYEIQPNTDSPTEQIPK